MSNKKRKIALLAQREKLGVFYNSNTGEVNLGRLPKSNKEAQGYSNFWQSFLDENGDNVEKVTFSYQEKPTIIPLTKFQKFKNYLGIEIKPKEIEGEVREYTTSSILISNKNGLANIVSDKKEFENLEFLSKSTDDFVTRYVFNLEPLCYRTLVPLELVTKIKLKENQN